MLNQTVLVGRIVSDPELMQTENGKVFTNITLAIPRSFKNAEGVYDTDYIKCTLFKGVAENTAEYCRKGDLVGVKGRLQSNNYEDKEGNKKFSIDIVADKVTFLTSKSPKDLESER